MYASLKRGDFKEHQKLKEDKRLSRRQRKRIKDEAIDRIVSSPLSNRMLEPSAIDENVLYCIIEMGDAYEDIPSRLNSQKCVCENEG